VLETHSVCFKFVGTLSEMVVPTAPLHLDELWLWVTADSSFLLLCPTSTSKMSSVGKNWA